MFHTSSVKGKENTAILYLDRDYNNQKQALNYTGMRRTLIIHKFCYTYLPEWILIC